MDFSGCVRHSFTLQKNSFSTDVMIFCKMHACWSGWKWFSTKTYFTELTLCLWSECIPAIFRITCIIWKNENHDFSRKKRHLFSLLLQTSSLEVRGSTGSYLWVVLAVFCSKQPGPVHWCVIYEWWKHFFNCLAFRKRNLLEDFEWSISCL